MALLSIRAQGLLAANHPSLRRCAQVLANYHQWRDDWPFGFIDPPAAKERTLQILGFMPVSLEDEPGKACKAPYCGWSLEQQTTLEMKSWSDDTQFTVVSEAARAGGGHIAARCGRQGLGEALVGTRLLAWRPSRSLPCPAGCCTLAPSYVLPCRRPAICRLQ